MDTDPTAIAVTALLGVSAVVQLVDGVRLLITGRVGRLTQRRLKGRGGIGDPISLAVWQISWGVGLLIMCEAYVIGKTSTNPPMAITGVVLLFGGLLLSVARDRHIKRRAVIAAEASTADA